MLSISILVSRFWPGRVLGCVEVSVDGWAPLLALGALVTSIPLVYSWVSTLAPPVPQLAPPQPPPAGRCRFYSIPIATSFSHSRSWTSLFLPHCYFILPIACRPAQLLRRAWLARVPAPQAPPLIPSSVRLMSLSSAFSPSSPLKLWPLHQGRGAAPNPATCGGLWVWPLQGVDVGDLSSSVWYAGTQTPSNLHNLAIMLYM